MADKRGCSAPTRIRDAEHQKAGLWVIRVTWRQLTEQPYAVVVRLARALAAGRRAG
jgi:hypothetical protein